MNRTRTGKNVKRLIVWLLMLTMVFSLLPMAAFADEAVVEPVVSEEPVQEPEPSSEPSSEPSAEPSQEPEAPVEEPTDVIVIDGDELPEDELDTLAAEEGVISEDAIPDPSTAELPTAATNSIRAVMLDCGRKYFTVGEIEALIDAMARYGYNQLQLSFGNGGCRFLLDEMTLKFKDSDGTTVTINSDSVKTNIKNGNVQFNGDESTLSQSEMNMIISYAQEKGISIVPMLNMPGHSTAIMNGYSEYQSTKEKTKGNLDVDNLTARNYGYALLSKYVDYFASKGCKYFSFGSDESGFDGNGMTSFVTGCAKIIANAGMRPRAFNDATNVATYPTYVQISYWHQESNSKIPTVLANDGHEMLNTHGRWYYVIKNEQYDSNRENKYWTGKVNSAVTSVELPATKVTGLDDGRWTGLNEYFTADPNNGTVVGSSVGTMFCIWCDASQNAYLTGEQVLSYNENYGALYQLQKLAEHYWPEAIKEPTTPDIPEPGTGEKKTINLTVGQTSDKITVDGDYSAAATGDNYVATVAPNAATVPGKTTYVRTSLNDTSVENKTFYVYDKDTLGTANPTETLTFEDAGSEKYYIKNSAGKYIYPYNNRVTENNSRNTTVSVNGDVDSGYTISYTYYYGYRTSYLTVASGKLSASLSLSKIYLYKPSTTEPTTQTTFSFTGTGEGTTTATIAGVEYTINVTAPETSENKTLNFGESFTLPAGAEASVVSGDNLVTIADGKVTAGAAAGSAVVTAVTKNGGGKVTARYTYNITISEVDPSGVAPLHVELWITNDWIGENSSPSSLQTHDVAASEVYGEDGKNLGDLVVSPAYKHKDDDQRYYYWKGVVLHDGKKQEPTKESMVDAGDSFHQLRWYAGNWEYFHDNTWKAIKSDDTVIAYYLQKFTVSKEIDTFTRDYGASPHGEQTPNWGGGYDGFAGVAFAVVYPDGTLSRTEKEMYQNSELLYTTANPNSAGLVYAKNNSNYVISHITATRGRHTVEYAGSGSGTGAWTENGEIQWNKITRDDGSKWYDEVTVWNKESGTEPSVLFDGLEVDGKTFELRKDDALLVLIYLEVVYTPDNLNLVYWDDAANTRINPNDIQIVVESGVTFLDREKGLKGVDPLQAGQITLPDDAYIINSSGETQYISKNIAGITGVAAKYRSGIYEYYKADISEDGKTLTLHYRIKEVAGVHSFVVDFGLPVEFTGLLSWFNIKDATTLEYLSVASGKKLTESTGSYGSIKIDENTWNSMTYTLDKPLSGVAIIPLFAKFKDNSGQSATAINVIPASNVYYEDGFANFKDGQNTASKAKWEVVGKETTAYQALSELGKDPYAYGYDPAYNKENSATFSMGSAHKVTVTSSMRDGWSQELSAWPTAKFSFKGTGFDVISLTNNTSGAIIVDVYDSNGNKVKGYFVDNYLGYGFVDGKWTEKATGDNILYQIPVMKVCDLPYDSYNVTITVFYNDAFEHNGDESYDFWLDAIRVYDPMGKDDTRYVGDGEGYPQYINLRDQIAASGSNVGIKNTLFIDGNAKAEVADYRNLGPNNEVYLANGQAISFKLPANDNIEKVQIGAKAPAGESGMTVNSETPTGIASATEMYYDITSQAKNGQVTITNTTGNILSLTNIKITFSKPNADVSLAPLSEGDAEAAVATVRALFAAPVDPEPTEPEQPEEPEKTFKPERFEPSWSSNVRKGGRAVLTVKASTDVDAIIVDGVTYTKYFTRTERVGRSWNAQRVTYREFVYMMTVNESGTLTVPVVAVSNEQGESSPYETTLTVKPSSPIRDWIGGLFGRWF